MTKSDWLFGRGLRLFAQFAKKLEDAEACAALRVLGVGIGAFDGLAQPTGGR